MGATGPKRDILSAYERQIVAAPKLLFCMVLLLPEILIDPERCSARVLGVRLQLLLGKEV